MSPLYSLTPPAAAERVADAAISAAVETLLAARKGLVPNSLAVCTRAGVVELTGLAASLLARQRAGEAVLAVRGVCGLYNHLQISAAEVPDADLQSAVARALSDDPATDAYRVQCAVRAGVVSVRGRVRTWTEKQLVLRVLAGVGGVQAIAGEELSIQGGEAADSDEHLAGRLRELLDWDVRLNNALVDVRISEQVAYLAGTVSSAADKDRVVALAYQSGVVRVEAGEVAVAYWGLLGGEQRWGSLAPTTDAGIARAVRDTLLLNPRVRASEIQVHVLYGVVTLTGTVSSLRTKQAAEQDARHVAGVGNVHNRLHVRAEPRVLDAAIVLTLTAALARDPYVGTVAFGIQAHQGRVRLTGQVGTYEEFEEAGDVAAGISGVGSVDNQVEVAADWPRRAAPAAAEAAPGPTPAGATPDETLAGRIVARLTWSAHLRGQQIGVQVAHGLVTFTGTVDTWDDLDLVTRHAREAGARAISNGLHVRTALSFRSGLPQATDTFRL